VFDFKCRFSYLNFLILISDLNLHYAPGMHKDSEWMGVTIGSDASAYPFVLEITIMDDKGDFSGTIKWYVFSPSPHPYPGPSLPPHPVSPFPLCRPTLGKGAVTKVKGSVKGDEVKFEEYEAVTGADDVELPMYCI
jgi:hypothetical protein